MGVADTNSDCETFENMFKSRFEFCSSKCDLLPIACCLANTINVEHIHEVSVMDLLGFFPKRAI